MIYSGMSSIGMKKMVDDERATFRREHAEAAN
jgi:hypothetical protein